MESLSALKNNFFDQYSQIILVDNDLTITETDNSLFRLKKDTKIYTLHPFFYSISDFINQESEKSAFYPCIQIQQHGKTYYIDIHFNKEDHNLTAVFLIDNSSFYKELNEIHQKRNEATIKYRVTKDQNEVLEKQRQFKTNFISNINHEVRSPVNAILGFLDILKAGKLDREQLDIVDVIQQSSKRLVRIIKDLSDMSSIEIGELYIEKKQFNLKEVLKSITESYKLRANLKGLVFNIMIDKSTPVNLLGDEDRLNQILDNLLDNAIKFTNSGEVTLHVAPLKVSPRRAILCFKVSDTGLGMNQEALKIIHDKFDKLDEGGFSVGTGLGLNISKKLIDRLDGSLDIQSIPGEGSLFTIELPFTISQSKRAKSEKQPKNKDQDISEETYRVLIADDLEINQMLILKILKSQTNLKVDIAKNGELALKLLQNYHYDLAILDLVMPIIDGMDLTAIIRNSENEALKNIPIIVTSAHDNEKIKKEAYDNGINEYFVKPFDGAKLIDSIYHLIKKNNK